MRKWWCWIRGCSLSRWNDCAMRTCKNRKAKRSWARQALSSLAFASQAVCTTQQHSNMHKGLDPGTLQNGCVCNACADTYRHGSPNNRHTCQQQLPVTVAPCANMLHLFCKYLHTDLPGLPNAYAANSQPAIAWFGNSHLSGVTQSTPTLYGRVCHVALTCENALQQRQWLQPSQAHLCNAGVLQVDTCELVHQLAHRRHGHIRHKFGDWRSAFWAAANADAVATPV